MFESDESIAKYTKRISYSCQKLGVREGDIEDATQDVLLRYFQKGKNQLVDHAVIDWLRINYGDKRRGSFEQINSLRFPNKTLNTVKDARSEDRSKEDLRRVLAASDVKSLDKLIFIANKIWGVSVGEIGDVLGVSKARICTRNTITLNKLYNMVKGAE